MHITNQATATVCVEFWCVFNDNEHEKEKVRE